MIFGLWVTLLHLGRSVMPGSWILLLLLLFQFLLFSGRQSSLTTWYLTISISNQRFSPSLLWLWSGPLYQPAFLHLWNDLDHFLHLTLNRNRSCQGCSLVFFRLKYWPSFLTLCCHVPLSESLFLGLSAFYLLRIVESSFLYRLQQTVPGFHNVVTNGNCTTEDKYLIKLPIGNGLGWWLPKARIINGNNNWWNFRVLLWLDYTKNFIQRHVYFGLIVNWTWKNNWIIYIKSLKSVLMHPPETILQIKQVFMCASLWRHFMQYKLLNH